MNNLSYSDWLKCLEGDKDLKKKWNAVTCLGKSYEKLVTNQWKWNSEKIEEQQEKVRQNIFLAICENLGEENPDLSWFRQFYDNDDRYVIQLNNEKMNILFEKIKELRVVKIIQGKTINNYLAPVIKKIWALKMAQDASIPQSNPECIGSMRCPGGEDSYAEPGEEPEVEPDGQIKIGFSEGQEKNPHSTVYQPKCGQSDNGCTDIRPADDPNGDNLYKEDPDEPWWNK